MHACTKFQSIFGTKSGHQEFVWVLKQFEITVP